jgi:hypothetical protein
MREKDIGSLVTVCIVFGFITALLFSLFFSMIRADSQNPEADLPQQTSQTCNINSTPTIFLYPALDADSEQPKYFENTTYEVIQDGQYLGTFEGNKFNKSFLNLSAGKRLNLLVSAKDKNCYVLNEVIQTYVTCELTQYITPALRCSKEFEYELRDGEYVPFETRPIKAREGNVIELNLITRNKDRFESLGCEYDTSEIDTFDIQDTERGTQVNVGNPYYVNNIYYNKVFDLSNSGSGEERYRIYIDLKSGQRFNTTTIKCSFFDWEYNVRTNGISKDIAIDNKDIGQSNPGFNITIIKV